MYLTFTINKKKPPLIERQHLGQECDVSFRLRRLADSAKMADCEIVPPYPSSQDVAILPGKVGVCFCRGKWTFPADKASSARDS